MVVINTNLDFDLEFQNVCIVSCRFILSHHASVIPGSAPRTLSRNSGITTRNSKMNMDQGLVMMTRTSVKETDRLGLKRIHWKDRDHINPLETLSSKLNCSVQKTVKVSF